MEEAELHAAQMRRLQQMQDAEQRALAERERETAAQAQAQQHAKRTQALKSALAITGIGALVLWLLDDKKERKASSATQDGAKTTPTEAQAALAQRQGYRFGKQTITDHLRNIAGILGKCALTSEEVSGYCTMFSNEFQASVTEHFGTLEAALEAAGLTLERPHTTTEVEIIGDLQRVAQNLGQQSLTMNDYTALGHYSLVLVAEFFGSFEEALEAADLRRPIPTEHASYEIFMDLFRVARKLGVEMKDLAYIEYLRHGRFTPPDIIKHCRGMPWPAAVHEIIQQNKLK